MRKQEGFLRRVGGAVLLAAMVLPIGVPALADDGGRPGHRGVDRDPGTGPTGVEWTRLLADGFDGVEWSRLLSDGLDGVEWSRYD